MAYAGGSSLDFSHTQRITLRSESPFLPTCWKYETRFCRTLIATIKDFGARPCPRCNISIDQICGLGREDDRQLREDLRREDNDDRQRKVDAARKSLYDEGFAITGDYVDGLLKDESLVPTKVFSPAFFSFSSVNASHIECVLSGTLSLWL